MIKEGAGKKLSVLYPEVEKRINEIGKADILVGIPSFRNEKTISKVVKAASAGINKYFPELKGVIVNADGGSKDNTRGVVLKTLVHKGVEKIVTPYMGLNGKGSAFKTIFEIADRLGVKICLVFDSDLRSITPEWVKIFGEPIYKHKYGFVTPHYLRYKYDGTITNTIAYPLIRALYGLKLRQPIGGEFAFTGALAKIYSHQDVWETDIARFGIDIWMTTIAITEGFRVAQAGVGIKLHDPKDPSTDLKPMFKQVVGTIFSLMLENEVKWKAVERSSTIRTFGKEIPIEDFKGEVIKSPFSKFKKGWEKRKKIYKKILKEENYKRLGTLTACSSNTFSFPEDLWAKIIYDFAITYNFSEISKDEILDSLYSIYLARVASFVNETKFISSMMSESLVEGAADIFERLKPYLIKRWNKAKKRTRGKLFGLL